jgi:hypothetical protein
MCETSPDISYGFMNPFAVLEGENRDSGLSCSKLGALSSGENGPAASQRFDHVPDHGLEILTRARDGEIGIPLVERDPLVVHLTETLARKEE